MDPKIEAEYAERFYLSLPEQVRSDRTRLMTGITPALYERGIIAVVARNFLDLAAKHFEKEDEYAFPPLCVLPCIGDGVSYRMKKGVLIMVKRFHEVLPVMMVEHHGMRRQLRMLVQAADEAKKPWYGEAARAIVDHMISEEREIYPSSLALRDILIGHRQK